ncbi:MAG: class II SORL domain-containing protein [Anaerolineae bacterium]
MAEEKGYSLTEVNRKPEVMTDMARKHLTVIDIPKRIEAGKPFCARVKVGGIDGVEHPDLLGHYIHWLELWADERLLARADFYPAVSQPEVTFTVILEGPATLRALEFCNLHGIWDSSQEVAVE